MSLSSKTTLALGLLCASASVFADNCDNPNLKGFDAVYCFSKVYIQEDSRLNKGYGDLRAQLDDEQKTTLKKGQVAWIKKRNEACLVGPSTVNLDCALNMTRERSAFLEARVSECKSVGCATSKLGD
ncbi:lysozyme inhibitor LprI family protein [Pseudomonas sp. LRF_L74]|uniref:lysozyme inhibitor LprI family protein n=1 Tax=Pseudomonas sp. LRF_L74 TaxID=3369422 RepID=UPI003F5F2ED5